MKITVEIQTATGSIVFDRGNTQPSGYRDDMSDLRSAAKELQGIANAVQSMCNQTPVVQISETSMILAASKALEAQRAEMIAKSKAGKKAAADRRNAS